MRIDQRMEDDGTAVTVELIAAGDGWFDLVARDQTFGRLPANAIAVVMRRYGKPLSDGIEPNGEVLELADGITLAQLRFRAGVDADFRDYLVLTEPSREPIAALATHVCAALSHLAGNLV